MRVLLIFALSTLSVFAQNPAAKIVNTSRADDAGFQVGDHFEVVVTGLPNQPVSVRTARQGRTDWGPVIGYTGAGGRWSTTGQFAKQDFGGWTEAWTIEGKLAGPALSFSVDGSCLSGGRSGIMSQIGLATMLSCETAAGMQTFVSPSDTDSYRTPDGRLIPGRTRSGLTAEEYHMELLESMVMGGDANHQLGKPGGEAAGLITKMIGVNALTEKRRKT